MIMETIYMDSKQVLSIIKSYKEAGAKLHHFNGAQWYIRVSDDLVAIMDSSLRDNCTLDFHTGDKAVNYLKSSSNCTEENAFENAIKSFEELIHWKYLIS